MPAAGATLNIMMTLPTIDEMSRALQAGDGSYDGVFYFAVRTTGVFCRPSCPARKARPENVEYFASADDAIAAGYRACRRCHSHELGRPPQWVRTLLERIAGGSGTSVEEVNRLLKQFNEMKRVLQMIGQGGLPAMKGMKGMKLPLMPQGGGGFAGPGKKRKKGGPWGLIKTR